MQPGSLVESGAILPKTISVARAGTASADAPTAAKAIKQVQASRAAAVGRTVIVTPG
jgi:hypothetical protein